MKKIYYYLFKRTLITLGWVFFAMNLYLFFGFTSFQAGLVFISVAFLIFMLDLLDYKERQNLIAHHLELIKEHDKK